MVGSNEYPIKTITVSKYFKGFNQMPVTRKPITSKRKMTITAHGLQAWGSRARDRIDSTLIVERLQRVAMGEEEATQVELMAARMLLDRTLPTFQPIKVEANAVRNAKTITNDDLFKIIEGQVVK